MPFIDIRAIPVSTADKATYLEHARQNMPLMKEFGATSLTETWGEDVPDGALTDFKKAVALKDGESVVVAWITWPDRAARDAAWEKLMHDERLTSQQAPFDGKRVIWGGFETLCES